MISISSIVSEKQRRALSGDTPTPLYHQLYSLLKTCILDGTITVGMQLPTEQQLAREFGVSRITSKRALDELAMDKLVERQRGKGTFVTHRQQRRPLHSPMVGLLQEIETIGKESTATVLDSGLLHPPKEVREALGLAEGDTALYLARVRQVNGLRFGYYRSWTLGMQLPTDLGIFEHTPRMTYFRNQGLKVRYMQQIIGAQAASQVAAEALGVPPGTPLLSLKRLTYRDRDTDPYPVDFLRVLYHPERFEYHIDLALDETS